MAAVCVCLRACVFDCVCECDVSAWTLVQGLRRGCCCCVCM